MRLLSFIEQYDIYATPSARCRFLRNKQEGSRRDVFADDTKGEAGASVAINVVECIAVQRSTRQVGSLIHLLHIRSIDLPKH